MAVSLKASSSFLDKSLQALILNITFTRVILLSVLVICSVPNKVFSITFLSSWIIKCFKPSRPYESKKKMSVFGPISVILHQWVPPLLELSLFAMINWYFPFFKKSLLHDQWIYSYSSMEKHPQIVIYVFILCILKASSIWKLLMPSVIFYRPPKRLSKFSFAFFCVSCTM